MPAEQAERVASREGAESSDTVDLVDYQRVRDEIDNRTKLSSQLLNYHLLIVGAIISAYDKLPHEIAVVGAFTSNVFWLMWLDHTSQIYKLAAYIELRIAPRLRRGHPNAMSWERFMRNLDEGGATASYALFGERKGGDLDIPKTEGIAKYIYMLFGGVSLLLLAVFVVEFRASFVQVISDILQPALPDYLDVIRLLGGLLALALFAYGSVKNRQLTTTARLIKSAIRESR